MSSQNGGNGSSGWILLAVIGFVAVIALYAHNDSNNNNVALTNTRATQTAAADAQPASETPAETEPVQPDTSWHCVDATSYDHNAYNDNQCSNGTETRYVSDSQAIALDPSYSPGKAGAAYYNNQ